MTRQRLMPPDERERKAWEQRSSFVLGEYADDHDVILERFGLREPIERGTVKRFLVEHNRRRRAEGHTRQKLGLVGVPLPDGSRGQYLGLPETRALVDTALRIAVELSCDPGQVVEFLLTGQAFALPWIEVETLTSPLGPSFTIHVGSADVTAEQVRQAFVAAVRSALGDDSKRPLPAHIYPLISKEVEGRLAGLTWAQRWQAWQGYARHWGITGRGRNRGVDEEKIGYKTVESYRNYINKKKTQHTWIRQALDEADWEREFQSGEGRH